MGYKLIQKYGIWVRKVGDWRFDCPAYQQVSKLWPTMEFTISIWSLNAADDGWYNLEWACPSLFKTTAAIGLHLGCPSQRVYSV